MFDPDDINLTRKLGIISSVIAALTMIMFLAFLFWAGSHLKDALKEKCPMGVERCVGHVIGEIKEGIKEVQHE